MIPVISGIIKFITNKSRHFIYRFDRFPTTVKPYFFVENQEDLHTKWMLTTAVRLGGLQTEKKRENCQSRCNERNWFKLQSYQVASPRLQSLYLNSFSNIIHTQNISIHRYKLLRCCGVVIRIKLLYANLIFLSSTSSHQHYQKKK